MTTDRNTLLAQEQRLAAEHPHALYRGFSGPHFGINFPFTNPYFEHPREPRSHPPHKQAEIALWFQDRFGADYWNASLFASGSFALAWAYAGEFGSVGLIEPDDPATGSLCWSPVYASLARELETHPGMPVEELLGNGRYEVVAWQDEAKRREAALSTHELMLIAPAFKVTHWFNAKAA